MVYKTVKFMLCIAWVFSIVIAHCYSIPEGEYGEEKIKYYRERAKSMFYHAYDGYMNHAYPYDELRPLTCDGHNTWGSYSLSLIDAMDTLVVLGNYSEFRRVVEIVLRNSDFDKDINVSVFETNIRVVGGLLAAHLMSKRGGLELETGWPCRGPLLKLAEEVASRLLPAFDTPTGLPYGTVNLRYGVPSGETPVTCTAGVGTFIVEFGALSRLTGNAKYEAVANRAMDAVWERRSKIGLVGNHINVKTGEWTAIDSGIGAGVDSYFEYLLKGGVMLQREDYLQQLNSYVAEFERSLKKDDWYMWVNMKTGSVTLPVFQSLEAFWPGMQSLMGNTEHARKTLMNYFQVWEQYGATPEFYSLNKIAPVKGREGYPLRPELIESTMYVYQATGDPQMLHIGASIIEAIDAIAKTDCGYAVIHDVKTHKLSNRMESFFLAETTKYLYLLFDQDNFIHNSGGHSTVVNTPNGQCEIDAGGYVFNTEAHPIDMAALDCCRAPPREQYLNVIKDIDVLNALDIAGSKEKRFHSERNNQKKDRSVLPEIDDTHEFDEFGDTLNTEEPNADPIYERRETVYEKKRNREMLLTCKAEPFKLKFALYGETVIS